MIKTDLQKFCETASEDQLRYLIILSATLDMAPTTAIKKGYVCAGDCETYVDAEPVLARLLPPHDPKDKKAAYDAYLVAAAKFCLAPPPASDVCVAVSFAIVTQLKRLRRQVIASLTESDRIHFKSTTESLASKAAGEPLPPNNVVQLSDYIKTKG